MWLRLDKRNDQTIATETVGVFVNGLGQKRSGTLLVNYGVDPVRQGANTNTPKQSCSNVCGAAKRSKHIRRLVFE